MDLHALMGGWGGGGSLGWDEWVGWRSVSCVKFGIGREGGGGGYFDAAKVHGVVTAAMSGVVASFSALENVSMPAKWNLQTLGSGHALHQSLPVNYLALTSLICLMMSVTGTVFGWWDTTIVGGTLWS